MARQPGLERLRWQCRRGLLELDLLFEAFLDKRYSALSAADKACFRRLLEHQDQTLQEWLLGKAAPEEEAMARMVRQVRDAV